MLRLCVPLLVAALTTGNMRATDDMETLTLAVHNRERSRVGVEALRWDPKLASDAIRWARHLARIGYLRHSVDAPGDPDPEGENLWAGTAGYYSIAAMSRLWASERSNYKPGVFPNSSKTGNLDDVGHYTQMVWRSTGRVGCGLVRGASDDFFVCRYGEGGNVMGEKPF